MLSLLLAVNIKYTAGYEYKIDYEKYLNEFMEVMKDEEEPKDPA